MAREFKNYELASSPRPCTAERYSLVSSTVSIRGIDGSSYYCYVSFSDSLVEAVGKRLPRGVSTFDPAYLYVECTAQGYVVWAVSARSNEGVKLWSGSLESLPAWLKFIKVRGKNGKPSKA